jgi:hypothetical protein
MRAAAGDVRGARAVAERCLSLGLALGLALACVVGTLRHAVARLFTDDPLVLSLIASERKNRGPIFVETLCVVDSLPPCCHFNLGAQ